VRATRGAILDVIVDLRPESPTFLEHLAVELTADDHRALYVPRRFAHGYQTLEDCTEATYQAGEFYAPASDGGLSPHDPRLGISWPLPVSAISPKDAGWPLLERVEPELRARMAVSEHR
jgi:dTDP-4-dehydrorhamnose 3,5-epimerase